jgi:hypothetical protein
MKCEYCGQVMRESEAFYGDYCSTEKCFNSWQERLYKGPRYQRRKAIA